MDEPVDAVFTGGLTYRVDGTRRLPLDILRPRNTGRPRPVVLYVHGGGWHEGDRGAGMHPWLNPLLVAHGYVTASVTYRLSGEAHWPVPADDVRAAVRWYARTWPTTAAIPTGSACGVTPPVRTWRRWPR